MLDDIRVLDVTRFVAGPAATALLADLGADVIRIEAPGGAEDRTTLPFNEGFHGGVGFTQLGRNKRGLSLDLSGEKGRAVFDRLLATADIVVANLPRRTAASLGLDYDRMASIKPDIIFVHLTTFGNEGPYADRLGFDAIAQVMSGLTHISGEPGKPMKHNSAWVDMSTGFLAAFGAMAALHHRNRTGEGQKVETNLLQTALTVGNYFLFDQYFNRTNRVGTGNRAQSGGPADLIQTKDGWVYMVALGDAMFRRFMRMIGREELLDDPRFATDELRAENGEALSEIVTAWARQYSNAEILPILETNRIPAGPLLTPQQTLDDPHVREQFLMPVPVEGLSRPAPYVKPPVTFGKTPGSIRKGPPRPGEDSDAVLAEAGFTPQEIAGLREAGVI
ncbi:CoA transferase [Sandaracinobacter sp. RS1-74]|uniref:CaiB/BaiF CoA transferase family protein n=1 Tax=Sandaracinobacteroides sayramensis TaxID=2913411 RepID=UPI001EDA0973|nr:CoA transferase [Sandaracinobacteroides sayramensis]MCG2840950.1 CoA transferase [Sandaracinobacteroides sayramensis]